MTVARPPRRSSTANSFRYLIIPGPADDAAGCASIQETSLRHILERSSGFGPAGRDGPFSSTSTRGLGVSAQEGLPR